jgi:hypothetical protein
VYYLILTRATGDRPFLASADRESLEAIAKQAMAEFPELHIRIDDHMPEPEEIGAPTVPS